MYDDVEADAETPREPGDHSAETMAQFAAETRSNEIICHSNRT